MHDEADPRSRVLHDKLTPTGTIKINWGDIDRDRLHHWLWVFDSDIKQTTVIYAECVMAYFERAKVKIPVLICLNHLDKQSAIRRVPIFV